MRDILFKAKSITTGEWVEGSLMYNEDAEEGWEAIIIPCDCNFYVKNDGTGDIGIEDWYRVDKDTICQYTGLTDKNGNKIWENDILQFEDTGEDEYKEGFDFINRARVEFADARWSLTDFSSNNSAVMEEMYDHLEFKELWQYCEVVGNFFDNTGIFGGCKV